MSVPAYRRKPLAEPLKAGLLAASLFTDTMMLLSNEKAIPRRYRWCVTASIMEEMRQVLFGVLDANDLGLGKTVHPLRLEHQRRAVEGLRHSIAQLDAIAGGLPETSSRHLEAWVAKAHELEQVHTAGDTGRADDSKRASLAYYTGRAGARLRRMVSSRRGWRGAVVPLRARGSTRRAAWSSPRTRRSV